MEDEKRGAAHKHHQEIQANSEREMAHLMKCQLCGKDVSSDAASCPSCGTLKPTPVDTVRKTSDIVGGSIFLGALIVLVVWWIWPDKTYSSFDELVSAESNFELRHAACRAAKDLVKELVERELGGDNQSAYQREKREVMLRALRTGERLEPYQMAFDIDVHLEKLMFGDYLDYCALKPSRQELDVVVAFSDLSKNRSETYRFRLPAKFRLSISDAAERIENMKPCRAVSGVCKPVRVGRESR